MGTEIYAVLRDAGRVHGVSEGSAAHKNQRTLCKRRKECGTRLKALVGFIEEIYAQRYLKRR
jgi:hypothetical protein